jgi:hypothetical protein
MNNQEFIQSIESFYSKGVGLVRKKNADYATIENPFKNFESAEVVGVSPEKALLVRILDKLSRAGNILGKEVNVKDERIEDTLLDASNYIAILNAYLEAKAGRTCSDK